MVDTQRHNYKFVLNCHCLGACNAAMLTSYIGEKVIKMSSDSQNCKIPVQRQENKTYQNHGCIDLLNNWLYNAASY